MKRSFVTTSMVCPACSYTAEKGKITSKLSYDIFRCNNCGLEFVHPMPSPEQMDRFYRDYFNFRAEITVVEKNALRNIDHLKKFGLTSKSRLLDFGCGENAFVREGKTKNWFGYDYYQKPNEQGISEYSGQNWDFITLWGVLEHLVNPRDQIQMLAGSLNTRGILALTTVTTESTIPYQFKPPEHVTYWTKKSIKVLFSAAGLSILEYKNYKMIQKADVYLKCVLRTVPEKFQKKISHTLPEYIEVPTNEIFVIGVKE